MPNWLFADALRDKTVYRKAERHWRTVWAEVQRLAMTKHPWNAPWMKNPEQDGNPIFTAVCRSQRRGIRIIHEACPDADEADLDWWLDYFGDKHDPDAIRELVVACCPSDENADKIMQLLRQWVEFGKLTTRHRTAAS